MTTTAVIVETVITGLFTMVWLGLSFSAFSGKSVGDMIDMQDAKDISALIVVASFAAAYQIGWVVSWMVSETQHAILGKKLRDKQFEDAGLVYESVRTVVYNYGSAAVIADLLENRSTMRLAGTGVPNFLFLGVGVFLYRWQQTSPESIVHALDLDTGVLILLSFGLAAGCCGLSRHRYERYYKRMIAAYRVIKVEKDESRT